MEIVQGLCPHVSRIPRQTCATAEDGSRGLVLSLSWSFSDHSVTDTPEVDAGMGLLQSLLGGVWLSRAMRRWEREGPVARIRITADQARRLSADWYYKHAAFTPADDGSIVIGIPNASRERILPLVRWLGPGAEILEPVELRRELIAELNGMAAAHEASGTGGG